MQTTTLPITGHAALSVPHEFIRQDTDTDHLALFLPGFAYTPDMPLFYYAETLLLDAGADLLRLDYRYNREPGFLDRPPDVQLAQLLADATPALSVALAHRPYTRLTLIAKSLGTRTLAHLLPTFALPPDTRAVWLTPLLDEPLVRSTILARPGLNLIVIGTTDPAYDPSSLDQLAQSPNTRVLTIPDADHSLDIPGDTLASTTALSTVVTAVRSFLSTDTPPKPEPS